MRKREKFKVGDAVSWESQAGGGYKTKGGTVAEVVAPGIKPYGLDDHRSMFDGWGRDHESYLVSVAPKTGKAIKKLYWPRVVLLVAAK